MHQHAGPEAVPQNLIFSYLQLHLRAAIILHRQHLYGNSISNGTILNSDLRRSGKLSRVLFFFSFYHLYVIISKSFSYQKEITRPKCIIFKDCVVFVTFASKSNKAQFLFTQQMANCSWLEKIKPKQKLSH